MLDIKPYLPFCDALPQARAPPWVRLAVAWQKEAALNCTRSQPA